MRRIVQDLEYRGYLGLDSRADTTLVSRQYQTEVENMVLRKGVLETKAGNEQWGTLDHSVLPGDVHKLKGFDVGVKEFVFLHKGTKIYYGEKFDTGYTTLQDLNSVDVLVYDTESEMEAIGVNVGSSGELSYKILFKQQDGCQVFEFTDDNWIGREPGINTSTLDFVLVSGPVPATALGGEYHVRITAQRIINDVRVNESAPIGKVSGSTLDDPFFQEITIPDDGGIIFITISDSSPDIQTTHYGVQITRVLDMVGETDYSQNGNDPTLFYESISVPVSSLGVQVPLNTGIDDLAVVAPNIAGHKSIPGHLISVVSGNLLFIAGITENKNRIYHAGISGFYYHSELYDPYTFHSGGDDDGQLIIGLGIVQDHLLILKEGRTGIIPNRALKAQPVWRDYRLGIKHRNAFQNISEDEVIVLNQDGVFRLFNGIRYDREAKIADTTYGYSENIRTISEAIDPSIIDFVYNQEKMFIIYKSDGRKDGLVFHPRDGYGWTFWSATGINSPFTLGNGLDFIHENGGLLYQQNPSIPTYQEYGEDIPWRISFALMTSQISRKDKVLIKLYRVDGDFDNDILGQFVLDLGRITGNTIDSVPLVSAGYKVPWYQIVADMQISGDYIRLVLRGTGKAVVRGIYWGFIEKRSGQLGWSQEFYTPSDFLSASYVELDALTDIRDDSVMIELDAGDGARDESLYIEYDRDC